MQAISLRVAAKRSAMVRKTVDILRYQVRQRSGVGIQESAGQAQVVLDVRPGIGTEGFAIEDGPAGAVAIVGSGERGLLYGVGKFLRTSRFEEGRFAPGGWRGVSVPTRPVRGIYFASHFHNFYHDAPLERVQRYVEELALWGCNALAVWFDMHHFRGLADPAAQAMLARLRAILQTANSVGIAGALTTLANEGYDDSPEFLRAAWTAGHDGYRAPPGGHYHREVCPSTPGGLDYILRTRAEMLDAFVDLDVRYVWIWPYDQGGCTCSQCTPWGANGFLKSARPYAALVRRIMPQAKIVLSTWYFDHFIQDEWEAFARAVGTGKPDYADYLMVDDSGDVFPQYPLQHGVPGGLAMLNFSEISMYRMHPWGGYGANPLPRHIQVIWDSAGAHLAGGFPYSEGIFEDLNKAISLQHYWGDRNAMDTAREYLAYEASPEGAGEALQAVEIMEQQHERHTMPPTEGTAEQIRQLVYPPHGGPAKVPLFRLPDLSRASECQALIEAAEAKMTPQARKGWRWRMLNLRARIDVGLYRTGGRSDEQLDALFTEVEAISFVQNGSFSVSAPSRRLFVHP